MAGIKIVDLPALGRDLISTDILEVSLGGLGSRKITGQEIMNASKLAVGSTPIVSGGVGRILFQGTGDVLNQSSNLFWDNTNSRLGIGTASPNARLELTDLGNSWTRFTGSAIDLGRSTESFSRLRLQRDVVGAAGAIVFGFGSDPAQTGSAISQNGTANLVFLTSNGTALTEGMRLTSTRNLLINTTTDAGFKLDVNGTARVSGELTVNGVNIGLGGGAITSNTRVGSGALSSNISGSSSTAVGVSALQIHASGVANTAVGFNSSSSITSGNFNTTVGNGSFRNVTTSTNGTAVGFQAGRYIADGTTTVLTTNESVFLGSNTKALADNQTNQIVIGFNAIGAGSNTVTLGNDSIVTTLLKGNVGIGTSSPTSKLYIKQSGDGASDGLIMVGLTNASTARLYVNGLGTWTFNRGGTDAMGISTSGNLLLNQSIDAGFRLDVNGTARVQGSGTILNIGSSCTMSTSSNQIGVGTGFAWVTGTGLAIGAISLSSSAIVDITSTTKGFLPPRMTNAQRAAIASPAVGLIVYCTDSTEGYYVYKSTGWTFMV